MLTLAANRGIHVPLSKYDFLFVATDLSIFSSPTLFRVLYLDQKIFLMALKAGYLAQS